MLRLNEVEINSFSPNFQIFLHKYNCHMCEVSHFCYPRTHWPLTHQTHPPKTHSAWPFLNFMTLYTIQTIYFLITIFTRIPRLTRFTRITRFIRTTRITTFSKITRFARFTRIITFAKITKFTRFTKFSTAKKGRVYYRSTWNFNMFLQLPVVSIVNVVVTSISL